MLFLGGRGFFMRYILVIEPSSHISFHEEFPTWVIYNIIAIFFSLYIIVNDQEPNVFLKNNAEILDEGMKE